MTGNGKRVKHMNEIMDKYQKEAKEAATNENGAIYYTNKGKR